MRREEVKVQEMSQTYDAVNKAWKGACRALIGEEVGELEQFEKFLMRHKEPIFFEKSVLSGKTVTSASKFYLPKTRFIRWDEMPEIRPAESGKLDPNKVKDIDSIVEAASEIFCYAGSMVTGNSNAVEECDSSANVNFAYKSTEIYDSKYVAYSQMERYAEYTFGCTQAAWCKFLISCTENQRNMRCMEILRLYICSDCYYCANLEDCSDCLFSFNQRNKRNLIGNAQFSREEYPKLKGRLLADVAQMLRERKSVPSILEIMRDADAK